MYLPTNCKFCGSRSILFLPNMRIRCLECLAEYDDEEDPEDVDFEKFRREIQKGRNETLEKITMEIFEKL